MSTKGNKYMFISKPLDGIVEILKNVLKYHIIEIICITNQRNLFFLLVKVIKF